VAVALSLLVQRLFVPQPVATLPATPAASSSAAPTAPPTATAAPATPEAPRPTAPLPDERVLGQELIDIRALAERRASFLYLLKAEAQLRIAEEALAINNMGDVDRTLIDVDVTLGNAYSRSDDAVRTPILQLREQLSLIHDDLYVRPEGIDTRIKRLRQSTLSLVDEMP
jgi:hypothetical protein